MGRAKNILDNIKENFDTVGKYFDSSGVDAKIMDVLNSLDKLTGNSNFVEYNKKSRKGIVYASGLEVEFYFSEKGRFLLKPSPIIIDKNHAEAVADIIKFSKRHQYSYL